MDGWGKYLIDDSCASGNVLHYENGIFIQYDKN